MIESYTLPEAVEIIGKSAETIRRWTLDGVFEYAVADSGLSFRVSKEDVDAFMDSKPGSDYTPLKNAAKELGITPETLNKARKRKKWAAIKWANNWYVLKSDIHALRASDYTPAPKPKYVPENRSWKRTPVNPNPHDKAMRAAIEKRMPTQEVLLEKIARMGQHEIY